MRSRTVYLYSYIPLNQLNDQHFNTIIMKYIYRNFECNLAVNTSDIH